jgi:hypothetical protein
LSDDEKSDDGAADAEMSDGSDVDTFDPPNAVIIAGAVGGPGAIDDLGAGGDRSEHGDEGRYLLHTWAAC